MCSMLGSSVGIGLDFTTCCFWLSLFTIFCSSSKGEKKPFSGVSYEQCMFLIISVFWCSYVITDTITLQFWSRGAAP